MPKLTRMLAIAAALLLPFGMQARAADVPFISGGASAEAREELLPLERDYNLKIVVADKSGDYLAEVKVVIESAKKEQMLEATMEGPILLAKLAPGTYMIRATSEGRTLAQSVTVGSQGLRRTDFRWDVTPDSSSAGGQAGVTLSGSQAVPPVTTAASGSGTVKVSADRSVIGSVQATGIDATGAHIAMGAIGENGPVIIALVKTGADVWSVPPGARFTDAQYDAFKAGNLYVNVHSETNKDGELRGQLRP